MSTGPTYTAQMDTTNGHGTLTITLHGRHRAEKHFQTIAAQLMARDTGTLHITETLVSAPQTRTYRVAPTKAPQTPQEATA